MTLGKYLTVRVTDERKTEFHKKAKRYGKPSDVLREIVEAFIDGRLVIKPDPKKESLYVRTEN
jgi:hypothetical protein